MKALTTKRAMTLQRIVDAVKERFDDKQADVSLKWGELRYLLSVAEKVRALKTEKAGLLAILDAARTKVPMGTIVYGQIIGALKAMRESEDDDA